MKKPKVATRAAKADPLAGDLSEILGKIKWRKSLFKFAPDNGTPNQRISRTRADLVKGTAKKKRVKR